MSSPLKHPEEQKDWLATFLSTVCKTRGDWIFWTVWLTNIKKAVKLDELLIQEQKVDISWLLGAIKKEEKRIYHLTTNVVKGSALDKLNRAIDWDLIERKKKDPVEWELFLKRGRGFAALVKVFSEVKIKGG